MKRNLSIVLVMLFLLAGVGLVKGQYIHYSQFYTNLYGINPAATGAFRGDYRLFANYRQQWNSINQPFQTVFAAYDMGIMKHKDPSGVKSFPAFGISFLQDQTNDQNLKITEILASLAYNVRLSSKNYLTAGVRVGSASRSLNLANFSWDSQYQTTTGIYDPTAPTGEDANKESVNYVPISGGLLWNFSNPDKYRMNIGLALNRLNQPDASFYQNGSDVLNQQLALNIGGEVFIPNSALSLMPVFLLIDEKVSSETTIGLIGKYAVSFDSKYTGIKKSTGISLGMLYRSQDAVVALIRIDLRGSISIGASYDYDISGLKTATGNKGATEFMLIYSGFIKKKSKLPQRGSVEFF